MKAAVIGHPVAHSLSPVMHSANLKALSLSGEYGKVDVEEKDLGAFIAKCRSEGYTGLNITVPHKVAVMRYLTRLDESVRRYGSCNTVKFCEDGAIEGYNTDVAGFLQCLASHGVSIAGRKCRIIGCGGAGGAIAKACVYEGADEVGVSARRDESMESLRHELEALCAKTKLLKVPPGDCRAMRAADIIVNATPVGLKPGDGSVLQAECFRPGQFVLDIIPTRTLPPTAALARACGADAAGGLEFLVEQGARAFEIWTGLRADRAAMATALEAEV